MQTHLEIRIRAFCDENEVLQMLYDRHVVCDLKMIPAIQKNNRRIRPILQHKIKKHQN